MQDPGGWDPSTYLRFAGERARPFSDLVSRIDASTPRIVVDLGCGDGSTTATLAQRWPQAQVTGVDSSSSMLAAAAAHAVPGRLEIVAGDVRDWRPAGPVDVVVSNAVLHWVPGHGPLLARWAGELAPGGWLAVQVPGNQSAPTHALLAALVSAPRWAGRLAPGDDTVLDPAAVLTPSGYLHVLSTAGLAADVWETTYLHVLTGEDPVLRRMSGTVLRPVLSRLPASDAEELTAEYAAALRTAYPTQPDGTTVLPFRRVFAVGHRPGGASARDEPVRAGRVGQLQLVAAAGVGVRGQQGAHPVEEPHAPGVVHRGDVAAGADAADHLVRGDVLDRARVEGRHRRRQLGGEPAHDALVRLVVAGLLGEQFPQGVHPGHPLVAGVPDESDDTAGPQHPAQLGGGRHRLEPVRGLPGDDGVDVGVRQRDQLGSPGCRDHLRQPGPQLVEHRAGQVDGDDLVPRGQQHLGQQPGARPEVQDPQRPVPEQERDRVGGVARARGGGGGRPPTQRPPPL